MKYKVVDFTIEHKPSSVNQYWKKDTIENILAKQIDNPFSATGIIDSGFYYQAQTHFQLKMTYKQITWPDSLINYSMIGYIAQPKHKNLPRPKNTVNFIKSLDKLFKSKTYKLDLSKKKLKFFSRYFSVPTAVYICIREVPNCLYILENPRKSGEACNATILINMFDCAKYAEKIFELKKYFKVIEDYEESNLFYNLDNIFVVYKREGAYKITNGVAVDKIRNELNYDFILGKLNSAYSNVCKK